MPSLDTLTASQKLKILVYGESGSGKTVFATGFPTPVWVADFDGKVSSAASFYRDDSEKLKGIDYESYRSEGGSKGLKETPYLRYYDRLARLASGEIPLPKTIVLDSLTTYYEELMKEVLRQNPNPKRLRVSANTECPLLQDYQVAGIYFKQTLGKLLNLDCHVVVTAHVERIKDELTGSITNAPFVTGKLQAYLPVIFEEVYHSFVRSEASRTTYWAQTQSTDKFATRTQLKVPNPMELSWNAIEKAMS